jgi:hypothetical protein
MRKNAMLKNDFIANGEQRWLAGQAAKHREVIRAKYADEWNQAGFLQKIWLRFVVLRESQNPKPTKHRPSPGTLW